jgi:hypothetical protein
MRQLLLDVQARLRAQVTAVADPSVYILVDSDLLPRTAQLPAIGIKDGPEDFEQDVTHRRQQRALMVEISVYVAIPRADTPEAPIIGSGAIKGVLALAEDVHAALNRWKLDGAYYASRPVRAEASVPMATEEEGPAGATIRLWAQRKTLHYEFKRQELVGG